MRLRKGLPFLGIALQTQHESEADLGIDLDSLSGVDRLLIENWARLQATVRLFGYAALGAAEEGNLADWERFSQRIGWLSPRLFSMTKEIKALLESIVVTDYELMLEQEGD